MNQQALVPAIRVADVRPGRGPAWIASAFDLYRARPLAWTGLALGWLVITMGLMLLPLVGGIAANVLQPVFFASFALAARRQSAGERPEIGDLFLGFRGNLRALLNVGVLELAAATAILLALTFVAGPIDPPLDAGTTPSAEDILRVLQDKAGYILAAFVLVAIVKGALWFAPQLIAFHGLSTMHAVRWSVYAALSNVGAMVAYLAVLMLAYVVALIPWAIGLFVVLPVMCLSTYTGYVDVFGRES